MTSRLRNRDLGKRGEARAAAYLRHRGFRILETNYRCRLGEIDLVAVEGGTVVFVEVKSKRGLDRGRPEEMITPAKRRRLTLLARAYLQSRGWMKRPARFDVVAVEWGDAPAGSLRHYRNAFPAETTW